MSKPVSASRALAALVMHSGLTIAQEAGGAMSVRDIKRAIGERVSFEPWAMEIIESNGLPRWEMYLYFFSIDAVKAGFLKKKRGMWTVTEEGVRALDLGPQGFLDASTKAYREWAKANKKTKVVDPVSQIDGDEIPELPQVPPEELMLSIQREAQDQLAEEILERLKDMTWQGFERAVVQVLIGMGYGGSRKEAGQALQRSGDEGIDGIINEDRLGLDVIYVQAKKWESGTVGSPEIQKFVGALAGKQASKGIFITTSRFSEKAREFVAKIAPKVILIDGDKLAELMIEYNVGVSTLATFELKRLDGDFFNEE